MDEFQEIRSALTGETEIRDFFDKMQNSPSLQEAVRSLVPSDAPGNPAHPIWKNFNYSFAEKRQFDLFRILLEEDRLGFRRRLDRDLNVSGALSDFYQFYDPGFCPSDVYQKRFSLYLDAVRSAVDGPEVQNLIHSIVLKASQEKTKKAQVRAVKDQIAALFPVANLKFPRWIQGSEWPMGEKRPMEFLRQQAGGEAVHYTFRDLDTTEIRVVTQYY